MLNFKNVDEFVEFAVENLNTTCNVAVGMGACGKRLKDGYQVSPWVIKGYFFDDGLNINTDFCIDVKYHDEYSAEKTIRDIRQRLDVI